MNPDPRIQTCALCPKLCRHVCPVAVGTGREAATPTQIMTTLYRWTQGEVSPELAGAAVSLCTDCGACEAACGVDQPVAEILSHARLTLTEPAAISELARVEGGATLVAIECDERRWADALSKQIGRGVARLRTTDHLGVARMDHISTATQHLIAIRDRLGGRTAVVSSHSCARVTEAAGIKTRHLTELVPMTPTGTVHHPCHGPRIDADTPPEALKCCGAGGPLSRMHPELAEDLREQAIERLGKDQACTTDSRCASHLRAGGLNIDDPVSHLLSLAGQ
jgi:Fe-S oxidoreductase